MNNSKDYIPSIIEPKWQKIWDEQKANKTTESFDNNKKKYVLDMFPYPSGAGLHVGHPEGYTASDIYSRYLRANGYIVLHPMGWDAFGLPAENYAIKTGIHPQKSTDENIKTFKRQLKSLGFSYDWDREINTSSPEYYKWTQWLFLQLYKKGLAYRKKAPVNWCPGCNTVLANEQIIDGKCHRSGDTVVQKELEQWFFKITDYAQELLNELDSLDWSNSIKTMQRNWIGKSEGAEIEFRITNYELRIKVFTTRPDTLFGATYLVLAPEHRKISNLKSQILNWDVVEKYINTTKKKTDLQRTDLNKEKTGVELKGITAINPVNNKKIPVWIADYVLSGYGTGAIMAVPAHDERDFEFANKYNLPIISVISQKSNLKNQYHNVESKNYSVFTNDGIMTNSGEYNSLANIEGGVRIVADLGKQGLVKKTINYKLRDWLISRQRYWGAPIPIIYCSKCWESQKSKVKSQKFGNTKIDGVEYAIIPVPEDQLPVELPTDVDFKPTGDSPLVNSKTFHNVKCPNCGSLARRESDTIDTFVDSSWYFMAFTVPNVSSLEFTVSSFKNWLPVDVYVGGAEHAVLHLLYARFITKSLRDLGLLKIDEPFTKLINQGLILAQDGRKMSKSLGNVINPDDVINKYGGDTLRVYEMFMGPLQDAKPWSTQGIIGSYRFLEKIWRITNQLDLVDNVDPNLEMKFEKLKLDISSDIESFSFNTAIAKLMEFIKRSAKLKINKRIWLDYLMLLYPFAPHLSCELYENLTNEMIWQKKWVSVNRSMINQNKTVSLPVQVNGKLKAVINVPKNVSEEEIKIILSKTPKISNIINVKYQKIIYIPGKIINIVI